MNKQIARSIESMECVMNDKDHNLGLYINKVEGCIEVTKNPKKISPMHEIADWVQYLTNHAASKHSSQDLKKLHDTFLNLWNSYISQLTISHTG